MCRAPWRPGNLFGNMPGIYPVLYLADFPGKIDCDSCKARRPHNFLEKPDFRPRWPHNIKLKELESMPGVYPGLYSEFLCPKNGGRALGPKWPPRTQMQRARDTGSRVSLWEPLGASGSLWELLETSGSFWGALGRSGTLWDALRRSGTP